MYEKAFALTQRPFTAAPQLDHYYPAEAIEQARTALSRVIENGSGPGLLIGAAGTGKTLLLQVLAEQFRGEYSIAMLTSARLCTRRALLQNLLFELGLPYRDMEEGELRLTLIDHLAPSDSCPHGMLLLVDEAHTLPLRLLEEIRMITNLVRDGQPRVRLVLAGNAQLEERFANPKLESFNQRVAARCYLHALSRDESFQYVRHQISQAGGSGEEIFDDEALAAVRTATDGIPRLINQLCDHALMLASLGTQRQIGAAGIEEAWTDLQQLPAPWHGETAGTDHHDESVIEFGQLDDESDEFQESPPMTNDPESNLEKIEQHLAEYDTETPIEQQDDQSNQPQQFTPAGEGPEVELVFHGPHNPFGGTFEEEEVVVDRYAELEAVASANRTAAELPPADKPNLSIAVPDESEASQQPEIVVQQDVVAPPFDPASDPVMPDPVGQAIVEQSKKPVDDRDMIVLVDAETTPDEQRVDTADQSPAQGKAQRRQYRQLFSQLRRE